MKITTLIENRQSRTHPHLTAEWGLSLHIAFNGHSILFDTGASGAFAKNAEFLSVDLAAVDSCILSHHHYDHGGGLRQFLQLNTNAKVHMGEAPRGECLARGFWFLKKYVGLDKTLDEDYRERFNVIHEPTEILPDVFILPHIICTHRQPVANKHLFIKRDHFFVPDDFSHELVMAIKDDGKLVIFTGCSHSGILNMVETVTRRFEGLPVKAVIGGFHIVTIPLFNYMLERRSEVESLARSMLEYPVEMTYTGHCTADKAFAVLKSVMGDRLLGMETGSCFEV